jgi:hypothetical protein
MISVDIYLDQIKIGRPNNNEIAQQTRHENIKTNSCPEQDLKYGAVPGYGPF